MGLKQFKKFPLLDLILSAAVFAGFFLYHSVSLSSFLDLSLVSVAILLVLAVYSLSIGFTAGYLWRENLRSGIIFSLIILGFLSLEGTQATQFLGIDAYAPLAVNSILLSTLIFFGVLEYAYKNRENSRKFFARKNAHYAFYAGWLHLIFGFCMYVLVYGPEYANSSFLTLKFFSGVTGCLLLGALPVYLYLEENLKIPAILTGGWIVWGVYGFITSMDSYPVSMFFPPPEFILPPAPGYFFSSFIPVSVIIVYATSTRSDLEISDLTDRLRTPG